MADQPHLKFRPKRDATIHGRVPGDDADLIQLWGARRFRPESQIVGMIVSRVMAMVREHRGIDQAVEDFVQKLRLEPA